MGFSGYSKTFVAEEHCQEQVTAEVSFTGSVKY